MLGIKESLPGVVVNPQMNQVATGNNDRNLLPFTKPCISIVKRLMETMEEHWGMPGGRC